MRHKLAIALATAALCGAGGRAALAVGLRVSPGGALIQGIEPGQKAELAVPVTVMNGDAEPKTVTFTALAPGRGKMKVPPGYRDIPDPSWLGFSKDEVEVPAKGHAAVKMTLRVPAGREYHNQHWSVAVAVRTKAVAGQMFTLGLYPRFEIETSAAPVKGGLFRRPRPPAGDLAFAPSMETLDSIAPGGGAKDASLTLWNSTSKLWRGNAVLLTGEEAKKARIDLSGGWTWLPDASWVTLRPATIEVGPNASASIVATVAVPAGEGRHGKAWEAILMVRGGEGGVAFARLRIKTLEQATR